MTKFYNPVTQGFYDDRVNSLAQIGPDAIRLTDAQFATLYAGVSAGGTVSVANGVASIVPKPDPTDAQLWVVVRRQRNGLLAASDWTQVGDVTDDVRTAWAPYRQTLRDIPQKNSDPRNITWPEQPA